VIPLVAKYENFSKGLVTSFAPDEAPPGSLIVADNVDIAGEPLAVRTHFGYTVKKAMPTTYYTWGIWKDSPRRFKISAYVFRNMYGDEILGAGDANGTTYTSLGAYRVVSYGYDGAIGEHVVVETENDVNWVSGMRFYVNYPASAGGVYAADDGRVYYALLVEKKLMLYSFDSNSIVFTYQFNQKFPCATFVTYANTLALFAYGISPKKVSLASGSPTLGALTQDSVAGGLACVHNEKVFAAADPANPSLVYFSATGTIDDWHTAEDAGAIYVGRNDGDYITALVSYEYKLYIFKKRSIWVLAGRSPAEYILEKVADEVGCAFYNAAIATPGGIVFYSDRGIFLLGSGGSLRRLDLSIRDKTDNLKLSTAVTANFYEWGGSGAYYLKPKLIGSPYALKIAMAPDLSYGSGAIVKVTIFNRRLGVEETIYEGALGSLPSSYEVKKPYTDYIDDTGKIIVNAYLWQAPIYINANVLLWAVVEASCEGVDSVKFASIAPHMFVTARGITGSLVYSFETDAWTQRSDAAVRFAGTVRGDAYFVSGGDICVMNRTPSESVSAAMETPLIPLGDFVSTKNVRFVRVLFKGSGSMTATVLNDSGQIVTEQTYKASQGDTTGVSHVDFAVLDSMRALRVRLELTGIMSIYGIHVYFVPVKERVV